ncbi:MAG: DUF1844 domain-containing protein [Candidatus Omnitrophica bacterium]|nr:DUF1844 domain-containing protein [Candidatus Omnitrophota bacterium]
MPEEIKKNVDEKWKSQVEKEKQAAKEANKTYHQASFNLLVSSLAMQAMISMGKLENPVTKKIEADLEQARFLIDTLGVLEEKTKGNLTSEESHFLEESLFNLRMNYVETKNKKEEKIIK